MKTTGTEKSYFTLKITLHLIQGLGVQYFQWGEQWKVTVWLGVTGGRGIYPVHPADGISPCTGADVTAAEPSSSDSRGERPDPFAHTEEQLLGAGEGSYLPQPPLDREDALQAATVANLRAALMSKNSLLSLKADVPGDDSSLLFEYLPKGTHSLSRKFVGLCCLFIGA